MGEVAPFVAGQPYEISPSLDLEQTVRGADVVVTVTPSQQWIVDDGWIAPGTHIAAIGGGLAGSQELDPRILEAGQDLHRRHPRMQRRRRNQRSPPRRAALARGVAGDFGLTVAGKLEGRQSDDQITVFDSTGIALQDSATVPLEYERALAAGVGVEKKMIST